MINEAMLFLSQLPFGRLNNTLKSNGGADHEQRLGLISLDVLFVICASMCGVFIYFSRDVQWILDTLFHACPIMDLVHPCCWSSESFSCQEMYEPWLLYQRTQDKLYLMSCHCLHSLLYCVSHKKKKSSLKWHNNCLYLVFPVKHQDVLHRVTRTGSGVR